MMRPVSLGSTRIVRFPLFQSSATPCHRAVAQLSQLRIEQREKFLIGKPAPFVTKKSLVARGTDTTLYSARIVYSRQH